MEQVIKTLSEIEERAVRMIEHANNTKKELAARSDARIKAYDEETDAGTRAAIKALKADLDRRLQEELAAQQRQADDLISRMQSEYDNHHEEIAADIFNRLIS